MNKNFTVFVAAAITASFSAGLFAPELRAQGGLPEVLSSFRPTGGGRDLDPVNTYNRVLQTVRDKYYGEAPNERQLTYTAIHGLTNSLDDQYTSFLEPREYRALQEDNTGEFDGIGAQLYSLPTKEGFIRIVKAIPGGPAARAGVRKGDLITRVDGKSVVGSNVDQVVRLIRGPKGTVVRIALQRAGEPKPIELAITRAPVEFERVESKMLPGNVGYVFVAQFDRLSDMKLERAIRDLQAKGGKGLVLDLRGNPGGLLDSAVDVSSRFVPPNKGVVTIVESGRNEETKKTDGRKYLLGTMPLVVLVNRTSASASEIVAGAIQDHKVGTIVGTTTYGKGLVQTVIDLEGGSAIKITTAKYLTPNGRDINRNREQRGGVQPDITVEVTEEEFMKGKDPQLARALEVLQERLGTRPAAPAAAARPGGAG